MNMKINTNGLTIPGILLKGCHFRQNEGIALIVSHDMAVIANTKRAEEEQQDLAEGLRRAAKSLSVQLGSDDSGFYIPEEMLEDANIDPEDKLKVTVDDGSVLVEAVDPLLKEWEDAEDDEVLGELPDELRHLLMCLQIHPDVVRDVVLEGGYEFE